MLFLRVLTFLLIASGLYTGPVSMARAQDFLAPGPSLTLPGAPQTLRQLSDQLYKRCLGKPYSDLSATENEEYCLCLSAQLYNKSLTMEERAFLATGEGAAMDPRKAVTEVYGQCIGVPGRAATYHYCTHTPDIFKYVKSEDELEMMCTCVNNQLTDYWDREAPAFIKLRMNSKRPLEGDLVEALMKGRDFPVRYATERSFCVRKYGRRD